MDGVTAENFEVAMREVMGRDDDGSYYPDFLDSLNEREPHRAAIHQTSSSNVYHATPLTTFKGGISDVQGDCLRVKCFANTTKNGMPDSEKKAEERGR